MAELKLQETINNFGIDCEYYADQIFDTVYYKSSGMQGDTSEFLVNKDEAKYAQIELERLSQYIDKLQSDLNDLIDTNFEE